MRRRDRFDGRGTSGMRAGCWVRGSKAGRDLEDSGCDVFENGFGCSGQIAQQVASFGDCRFAGDERGSEGGDDAGIQ